MTADATVSIRPQDVQTRLRRFLTAARSHWRRRLLVRGGVAALCALAGGILLLGLLLSAGLLSGSIAAVLRWIPPTAALLVFGLSALWAWSRAPTLEALALRVDELRGDEGASDDHLALTLLRLDPHHPYAGELARRSQTRLEGLRASSLMGPVLTRIQWAAAALLVGGAGLATLGAGGLQAMWTAGGTPVLDGADPRTVVVDGPDRSSPTDPFEGLRLRIEPPAYTGLDPVELPTREGIHALVGSRVQVLGGEERLDARVIREAREPEILTPTESRPVEWTLAAGDRGLLLQSSPAHDRERILPVQAVVDGPPEVELLEPTRDLILARGQGEVTFRARARDPYGINDFKLSWVHTRGGGESFDFHEESRSWTTLEETEDGVEGSLTLDLAELGIGPGEVLHLRATASDVNDVTGPGTGVSRTRQVRVIQEGEEMQVNALLGFPLELAEEPVLSQRMLLIMTEDLLDRAPGLSRDELARESGEIARQQLRLRSQVGEQIFSRATGAMQPGDAHLGDHSHGDDGYEIAHLLAAEAHGHDGDHDGHDHDHDDHDHHHDHDHDPQAPPTAPGSRYGVASIFDPSARPAAPADEPPTAHHGHGHDHSHGHGHDHGDGGADEAGTNVGSVTIGGLGQLPTGFGEVNWIDHHHDGDPILSVSEPLLAIYNAMWESTRRLELVTPEASVPHQEEALARLQALRENERVFPRGRVSAPPVDVSGVRGSGEVDDVDPAPRSPSHRVERADRWIGEVEDAVGRILDGSRPELSPLAVALLSDGSVPADAGSRVAEADERLREGDAAGALEELAGVLRVLDARTGRPHRLNRPVRGSPSVTASFLSSVLPQDESGLTGSPAGESEMPRELEPFVFATLRYESGNWDSGPLVPQNLIHSLAQYTDLPVAPEGVVVDLSSPEIFQYPVLYLTGHIPVRFSEAESRNLKAYVERGGFVFMDDHNHDIDGAFHRTVTEELARIFGDDALQPLPNDHELYRAFFHFEDGPPTTSMELSGWGDGIIHSELHAIRVNGRIGLLYSNKDYSSEWNYHAVNKRFLAVDNTRFGVNLLIYALTR